MHMRKGQEEQRHGVRAGYRGTRALREGGVLARSNITYLLLCFELEVLA